MLGNLLIHFAMINAENHLIPFPMIDAEQSDQ